MGKTFAKLEREICMREVNLKFLSRTIPIFLIHKEIIKTIERRYVKIEAPFLDENQDKQ